MIKKLKLSAYEGAIRLGGFIGWLLTVMYVCRLSLGNYSAELTDESNLTFLLSSSITMFVLTILLLFYDIEGILAHKWLRWVPGIFMAESGIALSFAEAKTMTIYSAIAGVSVAFGAVAVLSCLLNVKVSQRIFSIGAGLALGGVIRIICGFIMEIPDERVGRIIVAVLIGVITALTVHSGAFSKEKRPIIAYAESSPATILRRTPSVYFLVLLLGGAYFFAHGAVESSGIEAIPPAFTGYELVGFGAYALAALLLCFIVKPHAIASLFAFACAMSAASAILLALPDLTIAESVVFMIVNYAAYACFTAALYLLVVTFSLDRPDPLFFAVFGYAIMLLAQYLGRFAQARLDANAHTYLVVLLVLIPLSGFFISRAMRHSGFSQEQLDRRHRMRKLIRATCDEMELSEREQSMLSMIVLDGYSAEMMTDRLGLSRNTVRAQTRSLIHKFNLPNTAAIADYFNEKLEEQDRLEAQAQEPQQSLLEMLAAETPAAQLEEKTEEQSIDAAEETAAIEEAETDSAAEAQENEPTGADAEPEEADVAEAADAPAAEESSADEEETASTDEEQPAEESAESAENADADDAQESPEAQETEEAEETAQPADNTAEQQDAKKLRAKKRKK